ncbi:unnamed protein product [Clonostachys rhizophaga]|uniref:AAA+ ATPase domain-containing protein n=1 Tax=Clonostachys rhizophaga TaxID=160324 RepID=A0A9N9YBW0_9HYPO|nr:unnamed protein product [Clonostachys rhizophaga]
MHLPGSPALSTVTLTAAVRAQWSQTIRGLPERPNPSSPSLRAGDYRRRRFYSSSLPDPPASNPPPRDPNTGSDPNNNGKPLRDPLLEQDVESEGSHNAADTHIGRSKRHDLSPARNRQNRRRVSSALPPVSLPPSFESNNILYFQYDGQPYLPPALVEDAKHDKISRLYPRTKGDRTAGFQKAIGTIETYFDTALDLLLQREKQLALDFLDRSLDGPSHWDHPRMIHQVARTWDMILDAAWHLTDALYPARQPEYIYKSRPFWWWHFYKDLDLHTQKFRNLTESHELPIRTQLSFAEDLDFSLSHALADFPAETFEAVTKAIDRELSALCPPTFDPKTGKRPIHIISTSGYAGKAISQSLGSHMGWVNWADVIHLDAHDLSCLIGQYLGQDWAFSRGPLSMMGFRAAEYNGKLTKEAEATTKLADDDEADNETSIINVRTSTSSIEDELQKARQGSYDIFSKWENLKIDKILDHIIRTTESTTAPTESQKKLLIHIHDYVELSMTLEGSYILSRLRALVDAAWHQGKQIAIIGTSACNQPSEEYQNTVNELAVGDFVVTRHIQPDRAEKQTAVAATNAPSFNLEKTDIVLENTANINRMLCSLDPKFAQSASTQLETEKQFTAMALVPSPKNILKQSILPVPDVYFLASAFRDAETLHPGAGAVNCLDRIFMGPLRQPPGQDFLEQKNSDDAPEQRDMSKSSEETKFETRVNPKLSGMNEYEKRIASGLINRENIRTTFNDVHAPPDTISALKLLTSLALVRPDAFSYGVLAHDKITGCLLYGPPGTGKTMLAKAVAKESGANMLEISGASINDKWVGEAEKLIRAVFTLAKKLSPCVVFIDEADAMLANRSMFSNRPSHREHINQFLKEWDGMEETSAFIMVATNRPFDLDDAVLRRLPRKILIDLPLQDDRTAILHLLLKDEKLEETVSLEELAERTPFYSGSDLKNVCVAAAMAAVEEENTDAAAHRGPEPYKYPERRTLRRGHFERAIKQIPASISEDMPSLRMIRNFDEEYGNKRKSGGKKSMGFGHVAVGKKVDAQAARVRQRGF